ncbi:GNAT family N-acetyltransferase [Bacillus sp. 2205SS5-2]|uniref:GNAT family N-acetyltransferase n=1 Tax=Bacillus sp. 2205SS5-2 TaxID=3109031 RepID=UPI003004FC38
MSISFERITKENLYIAEEMVASNQDYNIMENGSPIRTKETIEREFINSKTKSLLIKLDESYIGVANYLHHNEKDGFPWIGLFMIHGDYQSYGIGSKAYFRLESLLKEEDCKHVRLAVLPENKQAKFFWGKLGYVFFERKLSENGQVVDCFQKIL